MRCRRARSRASRSGPMPSGRRLRTARRRTPRRDAEPTRPRVPTTRRRRHGRSDGARRADRWWASGRAPPMRSPRAVSDSFLVRLVGQMLDALATIGMVADRSTEQHDGTTVGTDGPLVHGADGQLPAVSVSQSSPASGGPPWVRCTGRIVAVDASARRCTPARPTSAARRSWLRCAHVEPGPLPPHERAWRHPSELGPPPARTHLHHRSGADRHERRRQPGPDRGPRHRDHA